jgi:hypothetical protein
MSEITLDAAIAALSVSITTPLAKTLRILSIDEIPQEVFERDCPLLFPQPSGWLGQTTSIPGNFDNVSAGRITYQHTLAYILAYAEAGSGRGLSDFYAGMAALRLALIRKIARIDINAMSIKSVSCSQFGQLTDPAGKAFYGCGVTVSALEYIP